MANDDSSKPVTDIDEEVSEMDSLNEEGTKYAAGLYEDNENKDYIKGINDLNNEDAPLDAGTDRDADGDYDQDDSGLVPEDPDKDQNSETDLNEVEFQDIEGMENAGDVVTTSSEE